MEWMALLLFATIIIVLLLGFPVAFSLAGTSLIFAVIGIISGSFEQAFLTGLPNRVYGIMTNTTLLAVPLFIFMGITLEKSRIAEDLLESLSDLFWRLKGGLGIAVMIIGMLLAASTGIVGATVVTLGLLALPTMLKKGYSPEISAGTICAAGTLGQIIPPSIVLVMLGDVISSSFQYAQLSQGNFSPRTVSVGDLFAGALIPGFILVILYLLYISVSGYFYPNTVNQIMIQKPQSQSIKKIFSALIAPLFLIFSVLGSILFGFATPTEAAGIGASGALFISYIRNKMSLLQLSNVMQTTLRITSMIFFILIGASIFSLVFRGFGGDDSIRDFLLALPGDKFTAIFIVMLAIFVLGFILDFIEITFVVVPIVAPILLTMNIDPIWLGIMIAINLQTSFLTPPFGFALFYLRGVAPDAISTKQIYLGVMPFVVIQMIMLIILCFFPQLVTWLPEYIYS
ncbi:TRAP transporter large permease subunit [Woeseiaceae bacterium]|jgi:tripartite ATP-independent transporter DctM subunit|nr:TRAP transporter large permease subunit [Woeseiaceae bacterium]MDB2543810.1 TRAP transporter large permease subunit [Woeseiaceae bacterium]